MSATYGSQNYTVNGKTVHLKWLETTLNSLNPENDELNVSNIGAARVSESGLYGVNGVFFNSDGSVIPFAVNKGATVRTGGDTNGLYGCLVRLYNNLGDGTFLLCKDGYKLGTNNPTLSFPFTHNGYTVEKSNVRWAVGGMSLCIGTSLTQTQYLDRYSGFYDPSTNRPRTAIGYKGGMKIILCTFFNTDLSNPSAGACNPWDVRTTMINLFGCSMGLNLDGGGSTGIVYKEGGIRKYLEAENRDVYTMLSVPM